MAARFFRRRLADDSFGCFGRGPGLAGHLARVNIMTRGSCNEMDLRDDRLVGFKLMDHLLQSTQHA